MRRHPAFHPVSRDHHSILLLARHLRGEGRLRGGLAWQAWQQAWPSLQRHLAHELDAILPLGVQTPAAAQPLADLAACDRAIHAAAHDPGQQERLGELLRVHARLLEDRILPAIQERLGDAALASLADRLDIDSGLQACPI
ncbi:MAG TPA: hypothetical protein VFH47_07235 [Candidatus Thermoplasmatota archaeon]|nr:hypothetical protein [Candidatus Thermoplasmatota archaeon]